MAKTGEVRLGVVASVKQTRGTLDARGKFTKFQNAMIPVHQELARDLAEQVVKTLGLTRLESRRSAESGVLARALMSPENRRADKFGFGVGVPDFMNTAAPYWRLQNDGTTRFVGRTVRFIRNKRLGYGFPDPHKAGIREVNAQIRGGSRNGRPQGEYGQFRSRANQEGVIRRPIRAQHYFEKALKAFTSSDIYRVKLEYALREVGFTPKR